ncbi:MAG TPA: hypothetical protein HA279_03840 [Candidatus Poseidoniaceae archaeon]|nr:hypothetical protein [Candidatus Poseidoniaceae archaeon]
MMEENVVSASGTDKTQSTEHELQKAIIRAGFKPRKRNSRYELLKTTIVEDSTFPCKIPLQ